MPASNEKVRVSRVELKRLGLAELVRGDERFKSCALFQGLSARLLDELLENAVVRRFTPHATVYGQGDSSSSLFWVMRGEAALQVGAGKHLAEVCRVGQGEVFGESAALEVKTAREDSARASHDELDVVELELATFSRVARQAPTLLTHLQTVRSRRRVAHDEMAAFLNRW